MPKSQKNLTITEPEISNGGIDSSKATAPGEVPSASPQELAYALDVSLKNIARLEAELASLKTGSNSIDKLAELLAGAISKQNTPIPNTDNVNRTTDFKNTKTTVDGRSLMEAQQTLLMFRNEKQVPISVAKSMASVVGSSLSVTVNGVRVCIPCDGRTYFINETHAEHIRERLAKIDLLAANNKPDIVEIG